MASVFHENKYYFLSKCQAQQEQVKAGGLTWAYWCFNVQTLLFNLARTFTTDFLFLSKIKKS